jgi:hypothetical protein
MCAREKRMNVSSMVKGRWYHLLFLQQMTEQEEPTRQWHLHWGASQCTLRRDYVHTMHNMHTFKISEPLKRKL